VRRSWRQFINKNGVVYIDGKVLQLPERAKPQFSYSVVLDGKTPIDFEYLLRDMDVTIGYKSNLQDTLLFRALTAKGAVRLRSVLE
jgi:signal peptidase I